MERSLAQAPDGQLLQVTKRLLSPAPPERHHERAPAPHIPRTPAERPLGGYRASLWFRSSSLTPGRRRTSSSPRLRKPDIRFLSAVDNDVEVVNGNALIYDRTVTDDGILRRDLQPWWQEREHLSDPDEATKSLCARLRASLPDNSPGQRIVLEVDGSQHHTPDRGRTPDTVKYAAVVAADRDLRLSGHEVYRFGHDELRDGTEAKGGGGPG
ncbi:hypothetical protein ACFCW8_37970, partial [Streptomyces hydrogenans]